MTTHKAVEILAEVLEECGYTATSEVYEGSGFIKVDVTKGIGSKGTVRMRTDRDGATIQANINGGGWQKVARVPNE